ncbi:MAG: hypothetical protein H6732_08050 [Alphaproteobacteria bacterium]|nr:hypothetical protein [Alphaproteobacteria bacterium]
MSPDELQVLVDQLDELLSSGLDDPEEALEVAAIAGMLARVGTPAATLAEAEAWRVGPGGALLDEAWDLVDADAYLEAIDDCASDRATDEEVEEALLDLDELVAAAVWCGRTSVVARVTASVERTIRDVPEPFAALAGQGRELARLRAVAEQLDVYGFWLAVADAGEHLDD